MKRLKAFARGRSAGRSTSRERRMPGYGANEHHGRESRKSSKTDRTEGRSHSAKHKRSSKTPKAEGGAPTPLGMNPDRHGVSAYTTHGTGYAVYPAPVTFVYTSPGPAAYTSHPVHYQAYASPETAPVAANVYPPYPQSPGRRAGQHEGPTAGDSLISYRCIDCGKARSIDFHLAHPVQPGEEPTANCCETCLYRRLSGIRQYCPVHGDNPLRPQDKGRYRRHFCASCGMVRSTSYHDTHPIGEGETPPRSYCLRCRIKSDKEQGDHEEIQVAPVRDGPALDKDSRPAESGTRAPPTRRRFQARVDTDDEDEDDDYVFPSRTLKRCKKLPRETPASDGAAVADRGSQSDSSSDDITDTLPSSKGQPTSYRMKGTPGGLVDFSGANQGSMNAPAVEELVLKPAGRAARDKEEAGGHPLGSASMAGVSFRDERSDEAAKGILGNPDKDGGPKTVASQNIRQPSESPASSSKGSTTDSTRCVVNDPAGGASCSVPVMQPCLSAQSPGCSNPGHDSTPGHCHQCHQHGHVCPQHPPPPCHFYYYHHHHHHDCWHEGPHHATATTPTSCARPRASSNLSSSTRSSNKSKRVQFASPEVSSSSSAVEDYDRSPIPPNYSASEEDDDRPPHDGIGSISNERKAAAAESQPAPAYGFSGIPPTSAFDNIPAHLLDPDQIENLFKAPPSARPSEPAHHGRHHHHSRRGDLNGDDRSRPLQGTGSAARVPPVYDDRGRGRGPSMYDNNKTDGQSRGHSARTAFEPAPEDIWSSRNPEEAKRKAESDARLMAAAAAMNTSTSSDGPRHEGASSRAAPPSPPPPPRYDTQSGAYDFAHQNTSRSEGYNYTYPNAGSYSSYSSSPYSSYQEEHVYGSRQEYSHRNYYHEAGPAPDQASTEPDCSTSTSPWAHPCGPLCHNACSNHGELRGREIYEVDSDEEVEIEDARAARLLRGEDGPDSYRTARHCKARSAAAASAAHNPSRFSKVMSGTLRGPIPDLAGASTGSAPMQGSPAKTDVSIYYTATEGSTSSEEGEGGEIGGCSSDSGSGPSVYFNDPIF